MVQGVGFRPFAARLAKKHSLFGEIKNSPNGASLTLVGSAELIDLYTSDLVSNLPPLAKIDEISIKESKYKEYRGFFVRESSQGVGLTALFPPDLTICDECEAELGQKENRRYGYPLINCQNCGPRFTVIESLPYDRERTSMRIFNMCPECTKEYLDIDNRRFHAEPISCPNCGPTLCFSDSGRKILEISKNGEILKKVADALRDEKIVALKGVGGFHLLCRADSDKAVAELRERKRRAKKPFALMFGSLEQIQKECEIDSFEEGLITSKERAIVVVKKSKNYSLSRHISHNSRFVGVFLPYSGTYSLLFSLIEFPLVATSANLSDEPIITDEKELFEKIGDVFDYVLYYDRPIVQGCDDSVLRAAGKRAVKLRNSRGYAPIFLKAKKFDSPVFCAGAHQKNSFALCMEDTVAISQHIGDLDSLDAIEHYEKSVKHFCLLWGFEPSFVVSDKNGRYASSRFAAKLGIKNLKIQHHKAHFLASLFERDMLHSDALGVVWDGTGLGDDSTVWGGELFLKNGYKINREWHLPNFWMLGGEKGAKEPRKAALSLALSFLGEDESLPIAARLGFCDDEISVLFDAFSKKINCVKTSSIGRLFDGVAALLGLVSGVCYEGESGLMIESLYDSSNNQSFGDLDDIGGMLRLILRERDKKASCSKFVNTLANNISSLPSKYNAPIFCSGGVFQNSALVWKIESQTAGKGLFFHEKLSPNDSSICAGQAAYGLLYLQGDITKEEL